MPWTQPLSLALFLLAVAAIMLGIAYRRAHRETTDAAQFRVDFADEIASPSNGARPAATWP